MSLEKLEKLEPLLNFLTGLLEKKNRYKERFSISISKAVGEKGER
jgi:hypothetical protein